MSDNLSYEEKELLYRIAKGEEAAFTTLVKHHWKNVYSHAIAWIKSAVTAEELTQDIFLKVWNSKGELPGVENFDNWLFIIARNCIVSTLRQKLSSPSFIGEQEQEENSLRPDYLLEHKQHYQVLLDGISMLPEKRRQIFQMSRLEGLTHDQIAQKIRDTQGYSRPIK